MTEALIDLPTAGPTPDGQLTVYHDEVSQEEIDRDHSIASESDGERTEAAQNRAGADALESVIGRAPEVAASLLEPTRDYTEAVVGLNDGYRTTFDPENDDLAARVAETRFAKKSAEDALRLPPQLASDGEMPIGVTMQEIAANAEDETHAAELLEGALQSRADGYSQSAETKDALAERIEEWAGILHDNPPSEAFRHKYSHLQMDARQLAAIEQDVEDAKRAKESELRHLENILESPHSLLSAKNVDIGSIFDDSEGHERALPQLAAEKNFSLEPDAAVVNAYGEGSEEYDNWHTLFSQAGTTMGDVHAIFKAAVLKQANAILDRYKIDEAFLQDIRQGRAANWQ